MLHMYGNPCLALGDTERPSLGRVCVVACWGDADSDGPPIPPLPHLYFLLFMHEGGGNGDVKSTLQFAESLEQARQRKISRAVTNHGIALVLSVFSLSSGGAVRKETFGYLSASPKCKKVQNRIHRHWVKRGRERRERSETNQRQGSELS